MGTNTDPLLEWESWLGWFVAVLLAVVAAAAIVITVRFTLTRLARRREWLAEMERNLRIPGSVLCLVVGLWIACAFTLPAGQGWWPVAERVFLIATILSGAWVLATLVSFGMSRLMLRSVAGDVSTVQGRRRRTQLTIINRLVIVAIGVVALGIVLFSFPEVRAVGTSLLASAGIVSVIAGLAAQSTLGNLIAGLQIAFTDSIRVGDIVVVEGMWGRIGEINLSYVVVDVWDERRLILPCTYFTKTPIESWTRRSDKIIGTVYMDLDWRVPIDELRAKFTEIIEAAPEYDGRSANVLVTGAEGGRVTVRFKISAANADDQWTLRCHLRESIVTWLQREHPEALPVTRVAVEEPARPGR
ncbi:mechanosensitive ion channel [Microbacterium pseudoresistens]|uniref:Small-conductance mechanosensitive channel n=1 Tax=Microbacterium pseudoresistens TaxID=640634 RepID=A0A7Y9JLM1_9MICO|nr:mechanosensitive ion channel family protein [Microbacterium pseudoresistens]NYD53857.1 small-conductance mechanosensitive channel [Microbacterium pseudoresistens]